LFGSGFCALIYQIGWVREFRLVFGASTAASAAVLAIFIGGLGLGGLLLGSRADRHARPLGFYSQLEIIVAVSAAASPLLLALVRQVYIVMGGTPRLGPAGGTLARLVLSTLVLAVPTLAMGGTLPAAARSVTRQSDARRRDVAALYGLNTLGAVLGCLFATFVMLETFGTRNTLWLAASVNLIVALVARSMARDGAPLADAPIEATAEAGPQAPTGFVLTASGLVGFAFFLMELVWYRMLGPILGGSVFTFGLILAVALAGIAAGGLVYSLTRADRPATLTGFAFTCLLEAAAIALAYALGDRLAILALVLTPLQLSGFGAQVAGWTVVTAVVVLPAALVAGYQFPMLIALFGQGRTHLGRQIGFAYVANTVGAIAGSLAGGFGLLPWLSAPGAWRLVAACLVALGAWATALAVRRTGHRRVALQLGLAAATVALLTAPGPTALWRHSAIGAGRASVQTFATPNQLRAWARFRERVVVWDGDGTESSVALTNSNDGYAFIVNGKSDGAAVADASTQVMSGLLGVILNPGARRSLVIGLGTGSTAGWLAAVPTMERVDVAELEPLILDVARACAPVNRDVLNNPKVHVTIGDARELLLVSHDTYDLIASEPSNPFRSGVASLFTREYYLAVDNRLNDGGMFLQWVQAYEVDARTLRTVYATMRSVFPYVESWQMNAGDLVLVGARAPIEHRASVLAARIEQEPFKSALAHAWRATDLNGFLSHYVAGDDVSRAVASIPGIPLNDDDRNVVEFGFARWVGRNTMPLIEEIRQFAHSIGEQHPPVIDDVGLDWSAIATSRVSFYASSGFGASIKEQGSAPERARQSALLHYFSRSNMAAARQSWQEQSGEPRDPNELAMLADIEADAGSERALVHIERLRESKPAEADTFLGLLRLRQVNDEAAAAALESALERVRDDPWSLTGTVVRAIGLAGTVGARSPALARRMLAALSEPFAVDAQREARLTTAARLSRAAGFADFCREAVEGLEPHTPWDLEFLILRRDCYSAVGDARAGLAERELADFARKEPLPFSAGLDLPPAPPPQEARQGY
jgi:spermidine synthase